MKVTQILALTLIVLTISSCSIEKRLYTKGYHVEWKKGLKSIADKPTTETLDKSNTSIIQQAVDKIQTPNKFELTDEHSLTTIREFKMQDSLVQRYESNQQKSKLSTKEIRHNATPTFSVNSGKRNKQEPGNSATPKRDGLALTSLILGLLGISILGIVLGMVQINKILKEPTVYGGRGMATAGILLGYGWIAFCSFFFFPVGVGVIVLGVVSFLLFMYGLIMVVKYGTEEHIGIVSMVIGWIGVLVATFLSDFL